MNIQTQTAPSRQVSSALDTSHLGVPFPFKSRYGNFIGGRFVEPRSGRYFENPTPITGEVICEIARSNSDDVEAALDAAHAAFPTWGKTSLGERSNILNRIANVMEENLQLLAAAETIDNGKPIRESVNADLALAVDHFRYFAGVIRAEEGSIAEIDANTYAYHFNEPLGVVGQIIPWNFPLLMATWKIAPALAAGNCVVLKPAEQTPASIMVLMELIGELLPPGVLNIVQGFGLEAGKPLAQSDRIAKIAFTGETTTGRLIMQYASQNLIPVTLELGGKSPNVFFEDVMQADDAFFDKCLEGFTMFALNQGEVCTCPSRALIQESIYDDFIARAIERVGKVVQGNPLDMNTMIGAQASTEQMEKIGSYLKLGRDEGAEALIGGEVAKMGAGLENGNYIQPTVFRGNNKMRIFQEEIFGPVLSVTTFRDEAEALEIANDTLYGLGAGVWTRDGSRAFRMGRAIQAGRVWTNCYHQYPAHAAFGGYKQSGIGRENHKMMLDHYRQTKNLLVSYDQNALGFF
ncbi:MAG: aldehyde dehydrogenase [Limimaricola cinnabarinus]|jgi:aldehyde dehydrogenase|uniref:Aldehyde dehydrogenase n=1 Tax=Limimaricola cinnabarinus LL-001 TaxID=1337093 RepID=U2Z5A5_9RHOB|nr:aldehyde dehydrogenase family protein [Limimaricola cinnabarinus]GAD56615.1 aldehyde dehydrogenase [Limimaricola cinnabarinus LL-001]